MGFYATHFGVNIEMSQILPQLFRHFGTRRQCFAADGLTCRHTATVGNVKIALSENIALLLRVDVPYSLVVT